MVARLPPGIEIPAVQHRDAGAGVAEGDREVDGTVANVHGAAAALHDQPLLVEEADLLRRVVEARGHQHRAELREYRPLGRARIAVRLAHRFYLLVSNFEG